MIFDNSTEEEYEVEKIVGQMIIQGYKYYLVKWYRYPEEQNTWEPISNLVNCSNLLQIWQKNRANKNNTSKHNTSKSSKNSQKKKKQSKNQKIKQRTELFKKRVKQKNWSKYVPQQQHINEEKQSQEKQLQKDLENQGQLNSQIHKQQKLNRKQKKPKQQQQQKIKQQQQQQDKQHEQSVKQQNQSKQKKYVTVLQHLLHQPLQVSNISEIQMIQQASQTYQLQRIDNQDQMTDSHPSSLQLAAYQRELTVLTINSSQIKFIKSMFHWHGQQYFEVQLQDESISNVRHEDLKKYCAQKLCDFYEQYITYF